MIPRLLEKTIFERLSSKKTLIILGARQVGKTTLLKGIEVRLKKEKKKTLYLNADLDEDRNLLNTTSLTVLKDLVRNIDVLFVDEAQRLDNPGLTLKIFYDNFSHLRVIATGSSSFDLKNKISDPLTGRYLDFQFYPLAFREILMQKELSSNQSLRQKQADNFLPPILLFGSYPEVYLTKKTEDKILFLEKIVESYLFRDIFIFQKIRHPQIIKDLTRALAYQIGSEINENELANRLKIDRKTVVNYLDILEKAFVIIRLYPFSQNPRREIGRKYKVYFIDLGIRNSLIGDFNPFNLRRDAGALWENFLLVERLKSFFHQGRSLDCRFWRSYRGAEIDYLEKEVNQSWRAFEFKYASTGLSLGARRFVQDNDIQAAVINRDNYLEFISSPPGR